MLNRNLLYQTCLSSGIKAVAGSPFVVRANPCVLRGVLVYTNGTDNATVTLYDNATEASGTVLAKIVVVGADLVGGLIHLNAEASNGIVMAISGTGSEAIAYYR